MAVINERIKERRLSLNLTLAYIAEELGVTEATAQRYESGSIKNISHGTIISLSKILKCTPSYLMGWDDNEETHNNKSKIEKKLLLLFSQLNDIGQSEALKRIEELNCIQKYTNSNKENL